MKCFQQMHERLLQGHSISNVRDFVQDECGELKGQPPEAVRKLLTDYRASLPPGLRLASDTALAPASVQRMVDVVDASVDELEELQWLYRQQKRRVERALELEAENNTLYRSTDGVIQTAQDILQRSANLKMDLGIDQRHLGAMSMDTQALALVVHQHSDPAVKEVAENAESRRRVLQLFEKVAKHAARETPTDEDVRAAG